MKNKILRTVVWVVVIAGLLLTAHLLVNYFNFPGFLSFLKALHGG